MRQEMLAALAATLVAGCASTPPSEATVQSHVDAATRAAGSDQQTMLSLCKAPAPRPSPAQVGSALAGYIAQPPPPPGAAFDNLFYVGAKWVSAWAIKTSDGIILVDALNNDAEAAQLIDGGLRALGLDPAQIRYVIVTHGHGDHYGGVNGLVQRYRPKVVMSTADWAMTERQLEFASPLWGAPPKRDVSVNDGDRITLGDTTVTLYQTAGHTKGTLTPVFDVRDASGTHRAMLWGGTGFNFGRDFERLDLYVASTERMRRLAAEQKIDVLLSNHANFDQSIEKLSQRRAQPAAANPFVIGTPAVERVLTVMNECAQATRERFRLQP